MSVPGSLAPGTLRYDETYAYFQHTGLARRYSSAWWSARFYVRVLRRYVRDGWVLDYGCGMGNVLRVLEQEYRPYGFDLSSFAVSAARANAQRSHVWVGDLESLGPAAAGRFTAIVSKHVMEHLADPKGALHMIAQALAPGGVLMMGVPNTTSLLRGLKGDQWIGAKDPTHCSVFPPDYWTAHARDAGLEIVQTFSDGFWDVPYIPIIPPLIQLSVFGCMAIAQVLVGRPFIPVPLGESFIMIARKPVVDGTSLPDVGGSGR